jgi:hypothetical protein
MVAAIMAGCNQAPPAKPEATAGSASASSDPRLDASLAENRKDEAPFFKGHEAEISRNGNVLTITANGKPMATFTDNDMYQWVLTGSFQQVDGKGSRKTYFLVSQLKLETDTTYNNLVVDGDGKPVQWVMADVKVFDGPLLASGLGGSLDLGGPEIDDWTQTPHLTFAFNSSCEPDKWLNATTIAAHCPGEGDLGVVDSEALITRVSNDEWQLLEKPEAYAAVKATYAKAKFPARPAYNERVNGSPVKPWDDKSLKDLADSGFRQIVP